MLSDLGIKAIVSYLDVFGPDEEEIVLTQKVHLDSLDANGRVFYNESYGEKHGNFFKIQYNEFGKRIKDVKYSLRSGKQIYMSEFHYINDTILEVSSSMIGNREPNIREYQYDDLGMVNYSNGYSRNPNDDWGKFKYENKIKHKKDRKVITTKGSRFSEKSGKSYFETKFIYNKKNKITDYSRTEKEESIYIYYFYDEQDRLASIEYEDYNHASRFYYYAYHDVSSENSLIAVDFTYDERGLLKTRKEYVNGVRLVQVRYEYE